MSYNADLLDTLKRLRDEGSISVVDVRSELGELLRDLRDAELVRLAAEPGRILEGRWLLTGKGEHVLERCAQAARTAELTALRDHVR